MTDAVQASTAPGPGGVRTDGGPASNGDEIGGARLLYVDMSVRRLLLRHARQSAVTRVFGIPPEEQSFLVTMIVVGGTGAVLRGMLPRLPRPSGADAGIGGLLLNSTLRGIAGAPSGTMPAAGALIAFAVVAHSLRPAVAGSAREVRALTRHFQQAFGARYGHSAARKPTTFSGQEH
jgi:hypothetical protein